VFHAFPPWSGLGQTGFDRREKSLAIKSFRRLKRSILGGFSRAPSRAYNGRTAQHIGLLGAVCPARSRAVTLPRIPWLIRGSCLTVADARHLLRKSSRGGFAGPDPARVAAARLFETGIEHTSSGYPAPKGGAGIKQIVRIEGNKLGAIIAAPGRKPEFTRVACLFGYQRLHEISSGQIREKSLKKFLLIRHRIRSQDRAQYGTVSYDRRTQRRSRAGIFLAKNTPCLR